MNRRQPKLRPPPREQQPKLTKRGKPRRTGREPLLTTALADKLCGLIRLGATTKGAAAFCGVSETAVYEWRDAGLREGADKIYAEFAKQLANAKLAVRTYYVAKLQKTDPKFVAMCVDPSFFKHPSINVQVRTQLRGALEKLKQRLAPDVYEQVLAVLADEEVGAEESVAEEQVAELLDQKEKTTA